ncbi:alpha/beta hydrolase family protein [Salinicola avicenniae]|uniref:alpha/beta hydrolase family protein n=1 Tax=Salinicola avicenniae TaxID=2916836 RepID=UPI002072AF27|nr:MULTISPECIES: hypothetical protein [unclassified Salinicola]
MQYPAWARLCGALLTAGLAGSGLPAAADANNDSDHDPSRQLEDDAEAMASAGCPSWLPDATRCFAGQDTHGAYYWIAIPADWNHKLVLHSHGGPRPNAPRPDDPLDIDLRQYEVMVREGYAWAGSSYRRGGYGVRMAAEDTDYLRQLFVARFGRPDRIYLHGQSWGGNVAAKAMELYGEAPDGRRRYDGALLTSGVLGGGTQAYQFRADLRAVYQYYCANHPYPDEPQYPLWEGLPEGSDMTPDQLNARVEACTGVDRPPEQRSVLQQQTLDNIVGVIRIPAATLKAHMRWSTFLFRDMVEERLGGASPFSNRQVRYRGSSNDDALNRGISRFDEDAKAVEQLGDDAELSGAADIPTVTMHAIDDPIIFVENEWLYRRARQDSGTADSLVQIYTDEAEHSKLSTPQYAAALEALDRWVERQEKPTPASIAGDCQSREASRYDGGCHFDTDYEVADWQTRVYARQP